jgi:hypothetical protein
VPDRRISGSAGSRPSLEMVGEAHQGRRRVPRSDPPGSGLSPPIAVVGTRRLCGSLLRHRPRRIPRHGRAVPGPSSRRCPSGCRSLLRSSL